jgi:prepilin signal peptidase PulO-like enzyme (type II secretory pathway)
VCFAAALLLCVESDRRIHEIPVLFLWSVALPGLLQFGYALGAGASIWPYLCAAPVFALLLAFWHRGFIGGGDVKLAAALGLWTGHTGILPALFVAFLLGSLWGIVLLLRGYGRKAKLPFGPCLAIGGVVGVGFGNEICAFYEALF